MKKHFYIQNMMRGLMIFFIALLSVNVAQAQQPDTKGKDFWLAFPQNITDVDLYFYISGETSTTGSITTGTGFSTTFSVTAGSVTIVQLPANLNVSTPNYVENKGIHVTSNAEVTIYGLNQYPYTTDAYVALPTDILGTEYMAMNYSGNAQTTIVAAEDNTSITITYKDNGYGFTNGVPRTIIMNQGQTFKIQSSDGTGSTISSDKPIGVYGGSPCINIPSYASACDHIVEMLPPISTWGKNFVVMPLATRTGSTYRILASENSTSVSINGSVVSTLNKGQFYETISTGALNIISNKPVLVGQYAHGSSYDGAVADPFFMIVPPFEQYLGSYTFATPGTGFTSHWANVIVPSAAIGDVKLDGSVISSSSFGAIGTSGFYGATIQVSNGSHTIKSNYPIGAHIYGWGNYDSYGYPGGASLSPVGYVDALAVSPTNDTLIQYNQHCITATVEDNLGEPVSGIRVDFAVSGANNTGGFATTDANGEATYCYTGGNGGTDAIAVTTGTLSASASAYFTPCTAAVSETHTNISCGTSGSIDLSVSGAVSPYSVNWTGPGGFTSTSEDIKDLNAGTYKVIVKGANGCPATLTVDISVGADNTPPTAVAQNVTIQLDANNQASIAQAAQTLLSEDFSADANNTYSSSQTITNWKILAGGIDLGDYTSSISGKEIDLSAFSNGGVESKTTYTFSPGTYTLSFDQVRNTVDNPFTVTIGSIVSKTFNSTSTMKAEAVTFSVSTSTTGKISFIQGGTSDANGTFVGNIKLVKKAGVSIENGSTDNCEIAFISASQTEFDCSDIGDNTVTLIVKDINGNEGTATATVTVKARPTPVAVNDTFTNQGCTSITFSDAQLLGNDYDPESQNITVSGVTNNGSGTLVDNLNGTYTYTPANNQNHTASLSYVVKRDDGTIVFPGNGHFYEFVVDAEIDWTVAKAAAAAKTYQGMKGYLATITSAAENTFATTKLQGQGWMGASDAATEGDWLWVTGPEAGTQFWKGKSNGISINGGYENWAAGEPNNYTGFGYSTEQYAHFLSDGTWNDYPNNTPTGWIQGYLVEYGGMPGDCDVQSTATGNVILNFVDDIAPTVSAHDVTLYLDASGNASTTAAAVNNGSSDKCGISSYTLSQTDFNCSNIGENTVTLTVKDVNGNENSAEATVTVIDNLNPTIVAQNITLALDENGEATIDVDDIDNGSYDNCGITSLTLDNNKFDCSDIGNTEIITRVSDADWKQSTVNLTTPSTFVSVASQLPAANTYTVAVQNVFPYNGTLIFSAHVPDTKPIYSRGGTKFFKTNFSLTGQPVSLRIRARVDNYMEIFVNGQSIGLESSLDSKNFSNTVYHDVFVDDNGVQNGYNGGMSFDQVTTQNILSLLHAGNNELVFAIGNTNGTDEGGFEVRLDAEAGGVPVVITAKDSSGNSSSSTAYVLVKDDMAPTVATQDVTLYLDASGNASTTASAVNNGSTDNCTIESYTLSKTNFNCANIGDNTVTLTVADVNGNSGSKTAIVTIKDTTKPTVATQNVTLYLDASGNASTTASAVNNGSSDNCTIASYTLSKTDFDCSNVGNNTVTLTVTDVNGNTDSKTAVVTVIDGVKPTVVTQNVTLYLDASGNASTTASEINNGSSDNCTIASMSLDKTDFDCSYIGTVTIIKLTVTDENGNENFAEASVTVKDTSKPTVNVQDVTAYLDASGNASVTAAQVDNSSADNCSVSTIALDKTSFNCSNVGENIVTLTVTDANGNSDSKTAVVTIIDDVKPTVATQNVTLYLDASGNASTTASAVNNGSSDNCTIASYVLSKTDFDCSNVGDNTVTLTVTDVNGNTDSKTAVVTVIDDVKPTVVTQNVTLYLDASGNASTTASAVNNGSSDNCTISSYVLSKTGFTCADLGDNTVTLTVTDVNGNESAENAIVTVLDNISPVAATQDISVTLDVNGNATITASDINNGSSDNCSIVSYSLDKTAFDCSNVGENTVTLTVTDASGNTHSATATVTVKTTLTADAGSDKLVYYGYTPLASATLTASGANGGGTYTYKWNTGATTKAITVSPSTTTTYTVTVTDNNGCTATDKVIVEVNDVRCGNKNDKVMMCHNGHEICIASSAVAAHLSNHSDCYLGACKSSGKREFSATEEETEIGLSTATSFSAYPNPFVSSTTLQFSTEKDQNISLVIYDMKGSMVINIFNGNVKAGVVYKINFDASQLSADMFIARLVSENGVQNIKIVQTK